jgi:hypothetical protein
VRGDPLDDTAVRVVREAPAVQQHDGHPVTATEYAAGRPWTHVRLSTTTSFGAAGFGSGGVSTQRCSR